MLPSLLALLWVASVGIGPHWGYPIWEAPEALTLPEAITLRDRLTVSALIENPDILDKPARVLYGLRRKKAIVLTPLEAALWADDPDVVAALIFHHAVIPDELAVTVWCTAVKGREWQAAPAVATQHRMMGPEDCTGVRFER